MNLHSDVCKFYSEIYKTLLKLVQEDLNLTNVHMLCIKVSVL